MNKIEVYSNWCDIDRLNGVEVFDGELLRVRWPDGSTSLETARVEKSQRDYQDHGHTYQMPVQRAYVERAINGVATRVWLRNAGALLARVDRAKDEPAEVW